MAKFRITLADGDVVCNGKQVTFRAPAASTDIASLVIDGVEYSFIDSCGKPISGCTFGFAKDALVSVLLDTDKKTAILVNSGYGALNELIKARATKQELEEGSLQVASAEQADTVKTITGTPLRFFVGTQAEYEELHDTSNLFAIITNDKAKEELFKSIEDFTEFKKGVLAGDIVVPNAKNATSAATANDAINATYAENIVAPTSLGTITIDNATTGKVLAFGKNRIAVVLIGGVGTTVAINIGEASYSSTVCATNGVLHRLMIEPTSTGAARVYIQKYDTLPGVTNGSKGWQYITGTLVTRII